jgi:hypothetical protein
MQGDTISVTDVTGMCTPSWLSRTLDDDEEYTLSIRYFPESPGRHEGFHAN